MPLFKDNFHLFNGHIEPDSCEKYQVILTSEQP
jgi:hypothetical protein